MIARFLVQPNNGVPNEVDAALYVLTKRDGEIIGLAALRLSDDDIAGRPILSPLTAKAHVNWRCPSSAPGIAQLAVAA